MRKIIAAAATALALLGLSVVASAEPTPLGPIGSGVEVVSAGPVAQTAADTDSGTAPVPTNENGEPMYLSQDGGDGEHASIAVSQGVRDLVQSGNYSQWGLQFGETPLSNEDETVFFLKAGDTYFRVTVTPDPSVAPQE